ncbi:hypothetical protein VOLCADRAFT_93896 [Volvox carteri f. nagariensis]|uniref:Uncharacterized protein n=1 Tax=Volvox carteri f. nagariensis TaxID=3068 RepID=D8U3C8_VOLCA|nr:uncharacterized protein VOLCADRAFT_93896 [Volvox carteri f. nagariensis]EFJ45804.1 hypothetical protein VOLCADRAFT_93896 [Volvox carteri f. nagariensis]|eukprot:XP_002953205.1 hypothetical protein VOLCADRAFT_93896 [Volvox carteri f. nagariensis]
MARSLEECRRGHQRAEANSTAQGATAKHVCGKVNTEEQLRVTSAMCLSQFTQKDNTCPPRAPPRSISGWRPPLLAVTSPAAAAPRELSPKRAAIRPTSAAPGGGSRWPPLITGSLDTRLNRAEMLLQLQYGRLGGSRAANLRAAFPPPRDNDPQGDNHEVILHDYLVERFALAHGTVVSLRQVLPATSLVLS